MKKIRVVTIFMLVMVLIMASMGTGYASPPPPQPDTADCTLTVEPSEGGVASNESPYQDKKDWFVKVKAVENAGYGFIGWFKGRDFLTKDLEFTYEYSKWDYDKDDHHYSVSLKAKFYKLPIVTAITDPEGAGMVSGTGPYHYFEDVTLTAIPSRGFTFTNWIFDTRFVAGSSLNPYTFKMPMGDVEATAVFEPLPTYNVKLIPSPEDKGNPVIIGDSLDEVKDGFDAKFYTNESFNVNPNPVENYHFVGYDVEYLCEEPTFEVLNGTEPVMPDFDYYDEDHTFGSEGCDMEVTVYYEENPFVWATPHYVDNANNPVQPAGEKIKIYLDKPYTIQYPDPIGSWRYAYTLDDKGSGTISSESEYGDFDVYFHYYLPETNTVTNTVIETVTVTIPAPTQPTTEVLPTEPVPLGAGPINFDSIYDNMEMPTEEVIAEEETPLADALPQTGQIPVELFYGVGGLLTAIGAYMKRKK